MSYDVWGRIRAPAAGERGVGTRTWRFRVARWRRCSCPRRWRSARAGSTSSLLVGWAFALAASTFCPLFLLGIWWTGLTARGAAAGMITGAVTATAGIFAGLITDAPATTTGDALLAQPAAVSVPLAFLTMWLVSVCDPRRPRDVAAHMLALHGPEQLGLQPASPTFIRPTTTACPPAAADR